MSPPASGLASSHNSSQPRGVWEWGLLVEIYYRPVLTQKMSVARRMKANYNHGKRSWNTLEFLGRSSILPYPAPPLIPQTTLDACFQNYFAPVATLYRTGEKELQENFEKDALFYGSLCSDRPLSPPFSCCNSCLFWALNAIHRYR